MSNQPSQEQVQQLARVYQGCVADGLEWAMAHLDYLNAADNIRLTLVDLGYTEMAALWDELLVIKNSMGNNKVVYTGNLPEKNLPSEAAAKLFNEVERKAIYDGVIQRFCDKSKPTLVKQFGEF